MIIINAIILTIGSRNAKYSMIILQNMCTLCSHTHKNYHYDQHHHYPCQSARLHQQAICVSIIAEYLLFLFINKTTTIKHFLLQWKYRNGNYLNHNILLCGTGMQICMYAGIQIYTHMCACKSIWTLVEDKAFSIQFHKASVVCRPKEFTIAFE